MRDGQQGDDHQQGPAGGGRRRPGGHHRPAPRRSPASRSSCAAEGAGAGDLPPLRRPRRRPCGLAGRPEGRQHHIRGPREQGPALPGHASGPPRARSRTAPRRTVEEMARLAERITAEAREGYTVTVRDAPRGWRVVFTGSRSGEHSLMGSASNTERVLAPLVPLRDVTAGQRSAPWPRRGGGGGPTTQNPHRKRQHEYEESRAFPRCTASRA